jgi:DNA-binding PadR family transcriptional regulator
MSSVSPTTNALLGLLSTRSWTGYELTQQVRRSLRYVWPASEGHLYREQKRLIDLGWATMMREPAGKRIRKRYIITDAGREAMRAWLATPPSEPRLEIEALVRIFYGDQGWVDDLVRSLELTRSMATSMRESLLGFVADYLEPGGPLSLLEAGHDPGAGTAPLRHGRPQFPERLHVVALALEVTLAVLTELERAVGAAASDVAAWPSTTDSSLTSKTRQRLERLAAAEKARPSR